MASPYLPLPPDSDDDDGIVPMSDDEEPESPAGYPYVPVRTESDTEEEDPEEDLEEDTEDNSWEENNNNTVTSSPTPIFSFEVPAPPRQTARRRVAMPERVTLSPDNTVSTPDRYQRHMDNPLSWEHTLGTLRKWRDIGQGRSTYERGETSAQQEPLLDSTPIIVDRMLSHENRMDLLEDVIIQIPEPEAYGVLEENITSVQEDVIGLKKEVQQLTAKLKSTDMTIDNMETKMEKLLWKSQEAELRSIIFLDSEKYAMERKQKEDEN